MLRLVTPQGDQRDKSPSKSSLGPLVTAVAVLLLAAAIWYAQRGESRLADPDQLRMAATCDNVAWNLASHSAYAIDFADPAWQAAVGFAPEEQKLLAQWDAAQRGTTTRVAPLFVFLNAAVTRTLGRHPAVVLWLQTLFNAVAVAILVCHALGSPGKRRWLLVACVALAADPILWWNSQRLVANDLSIGILALAVVAISRGLATGYDSSGGHLRHEDWNWEQPLGTRIRNAVREPWFAIGTLFGLEFLNRTSSTWWLVWLVGIWPFLSVSWLISGRPIRPYLRSSGLIAAGFLIVASPWLTFNAARIGWLAPGGAEPFIRLSSGYQIYVINQLGRHFPAVTSSVERLMARAEEYRGLDNLHREAVMAELSLSYAISWQSRHVDEFPRLIILKWLDHFQLVNQDGFGRVFLHGIVIGLASFGCWNQRHRIGGAILVVVLLSGLTAALTWSDGPFSSLPLRPLLITAAVLGARELTAKWWTRKSTTRTEQVLVEANPA